MNENSIDKKRLSDAIIASSGGQINADALGAAQQGDLSKIAAALPPEDRQKLLVALSDKSALKKLLAGNDAKKILQSFLSGGKKNG